MNRRIVLISLGLLSFSAVAFARGSSEPPLEVVPEIDLNRYAGKWYEIARFPNRFQKRCAGEVTASYVLRPDGTISVLNQCRLKSGDSIAASGIARAAGKGRPNSVLQVRFAPAFLSFVPQVWGDYQIISLAPDYTYSVVGDPSRKYLWILSRSPQMDDATYARLVDQAAAQGFDVRRLQKTRQTCSCTE